MQQRRIDKAEATQRIFEHVKAQFILREIRAVLTKWADVKIEGKELAEMMRDVEKIIEQADSEAGNGTN